MLAEHMVEGFIDHHQIGCRKVALTPNRRVAGREQQGILLTQWDTHCLRYTQDHVAARRGAARLDKAQMTLGCAGGERQVKLRQATPVPPHFQQPAERAPIRVYSHLG